MSANVFANSVLRELRFAARSLRRTPLFSVITITSLGFGLALAVTTLAITNAYLLRSLPYPDAKRLYHLRYAPPGPYEPRGMSGIDWAGLRDVVDATIISAGESYYIGEGPSVQFVRGTRVSPGFIEGLGVRAALGQVFSESDFNPGGPGVALIGHALWRDRFNSDPNIVGRELRAHPENQTGRPVSLRVVGVLPEGFWFGQSSETQPDLLVPLRTVARPYMVRLRPGVPARDAERRITEAAKAVGSDFRPGWAGVQLEPVHARYVAEFRPLLNGIAAATALVLLLVCVNVAILVLLRSLRRQKDMAVRAALGAGRADFLRLLIVEALLLCAAALALALPLTLVALRTIAPVVEARLGKPPPAGISAFAIDSQVILATGGVAVLIMSTLAVVPLLVLRAKKLGGSLRAGGLSATEAPAMRRLRSGLIALEIAGALVLLTGGGIMVRSLLTLVRTDLGFDAAQVARVGLVLPATYNDRAMLSEFYLKLSQRLDSMNSSAALSSAFPPFYELNTQPLESDGGVNPRLSIGVLPVGGGYFSVHGIARREGREFQWSDRVGSEPVAIVSESLARQLWPNTRALGRRLRINESSTTNEEMGPWRTVVGVVRDVRRTYGDTELRDVYIPFLQTPTRYSNLHARLDRADAVPLARVAEIVAEIDPFVRVATPKLLATEDRQFARARFMTGLINLFAGFATGLALLGIYGVTAFSVQQRQREIAIRLALGAERRAVIALFLRESMVVLVVGTVLGIWGSSLAGRVIESQVHGVQTFDLPTLAMASAFLAACGLCATWWPARRASAANLVRVLKEE